MAKMLSSPDMIKSVTRTLTPPVSPYHSNQPLRFNNEATRISPPSSSASSASASHAMPISDPLIDLHWPGRPKRNRYGFTFFISSIFKSKNWFIFGTWKSCCCFKNDR